MKVKGFKKALSILWDIVGTILVVILSPLLLVFFIIKDNLIPIWK